MDGFLKEYNNFFESCIKYNSTELTDVELSNDCNYVMGLDLDVYFGKGFVERPFMFEVDFSNLENDDAFLTPPVKVAQNVITNNKINIDAVKFTRLNIDHLILLQLEGIINREVNVVDKEKFLQVPSTPCLILRIEAPCISLATTLGDIGKGNVKSLSMEDVEKYNQWHLPSVSTIYINWECALINTPVKKLFDSKSISKSLDKLVIKYQHLNGKYYESTRPHWIQHMELKQHRTNTTMVINKLNKRISPFDLEVQYLNMNTFGNMLIVFKDYIMQVVGDALQKVPKAKTKEVFNSINFATNKFDNIIDEQIIPDRILRRSHSRSILKALVAELREFLKYENSIDFYVIDNALTSIGDTIPNIYKLINT